MRRARGGELTPEQAAAAEANRETFRNAFGENVTPLHRIPSRHYYEFRKWIVMSLKGLNWLYSQFITNEWAFVTGAIEMIRNLQVNGLGTEMIMRYGERWGAVQLAPMEMVRMVNSLAAQWNILWRVAFLMIDRQPVSTFPPDMASASAALAASIISYKPNFEYIYRDLLGFYNLIYGDIGSLNYRRYLMQQTEPLPSSGIIPAQAATWAERMAGLYIENDELKVLPKEQRATDTFTPPFPTEPLTSLEHFENPKQVPFPERRYFGLSPEVAELNEQANAQATAQAAAAAAEEQHARDERNREANRNARYGVNFKVEE